LDLYADGKKVGHLSWMEPDADDHDDFEPGWCAELWGSSLWQRHSGFHPDIKDAVALARELNTERDKHEAEMKRIDSNRPRTVSIPSGGQPR
jgi:hypothetical protein